MPQFLRSLVACLMLFALLAAGCGDDDSEQSAERSRIDRDEDGDLTRYCTLVAEYDKATNSDTSTVDSTLDSFAEAESAARAIVDEAPAEVRDAHERLATGAEFLVARLRDAAPATMEELSAAGEAISAELVEEMGDLEAETAAVLQFAERECGLAVG